MIGGEHHKAFAEVQMENCLEMYQDCLDPNKTMDSGCLSYRRGSETRGSAVTTCDITLQQTKDRKFACLKGCMFLHQQNRCKKDNDCPSQ